MPSAEEPEATVSDETEVASTSHSEITG
jgi:hypothetical protein